MAQEKRIKILYFGTYSAGEEYARNLALINGLKEVGAEVEECHTELWPGFQDKMTAVQRGLPANVFALVKAYFRLINQYRKAGEFDFMFVGYLGQLDVFLARLLKIVHHQPVIFDAFYSLYDTMVKDRGLYPEGSLRARILRRLDQLSVKCSDLTLLDTNEHIKYFCREFGLKPERFLAIPLGVDQANFYPRPEPEADVGAHPSVRPSEGRHLGLPGQAEGRHLGLPGQEEVFEVLNYSSYIPLHGLEVILQAAEALRDESGIRFTLIGRGQLFPEIKAQAEKLGLKKVQFLQWLNHQELVQKAAAADLLLGIFGITEKAGRVIPYKAYEALALARPLITGDSPAARELLKDGKHCLLSPMGDGPALAKRILRLRNDPELRRNLAQAGHQLFLEKCSWDKIGAGILEKLKEEFYQD